ncbi:MAG: 3-keto-5-aminohexanoate cleavage protein, partial [Actinomycetota bacterium]|nr:3-keto-5-aminohexanoate cleavage protein [Actinomycetota bacterium]
VLDEAMIVLPRLHHGEGRATWAVVVAAARAGRSIRIGLEDTLELPDGSPAPSNEAMVRAASELQRRAVRAA